MLQTMKRIQVIGPKPVFNRVVDLLYQEGTLHLEDVSALVPPDEIPLQKVVLDTATSVAEVLGKINGIFSTLAKVTDDQALQQTLSDTIRKQNHEQVLLRAQEIIGRLETTTRNLALRKSELALSITALNRYSKVLDILQPLERELPMLEGFEVTILLILKEHSEVVELIKKELETITNNQFEMTSTTVDADTLAAIMIFNKRYSEQVHSFIYSVNVNEVRLPREYMGKPFYEMYALIEENKLRAGTEIKKIEEELFTLSSAWYQELSVLKKNLEDMHDELGAFSNFALSEYTFVIMGWIPKKKLPQVKKSLMDEFTDRVVVRELDTTEKDMEGAPVFYDNPRWVKPFEVIMQLVAPPRYREVDPSPILAIFFPLFFGIMVGDIGYGIVILLIALLIRKKFQDMAFAVSLADILIVSSIPTIIFGYLFGEFFGDFGEIMGWLHPVHFLGITWNRVEAMIPMLILAIMIGVIHVFLGLIIGMRNAIITKSKKHLAEKAGMLLILIGLIIAVVMLAGIAPETAIYPAGILVVIALPLILFGAGVFGTIEVMSTVGNILSYARLMAIGMASVILAMVANRLGESFEIAIIGIIVALLLHALNIVLAMFSPSIHSMRLHIVEFFSKFYAGGGVVYKPFKKAVVDEIVR
ncbi:MAG: V-type ATPase 116kDa subunit family protein [Methanoregula sp.]|nr:V-type ATPase 116kDa subunit family protein [Methanoregula sp.]